MSPLVSVVIPSYNHQRYIVDAARSVLSQSHRRLELIVIDDGSSDRSVELLKTIEDDRLTVVCQENRGAHAAINRGLEMAGGEFLAILNSDDLFHPERLAKALALFEREPALDLVTSWIEVIDADGAPLGVKEGWRNMLPWAVAHPERGYGAEGDFTRNLLLSNFVSTTSNIVMRRSLFERIGGMRNLRFAHDWDFLLRAVRDGAAGELPEPLMGYRLHGANTISTKRRWMLFEVAWMWAVHLPRFAGKRILFGDDSEAMVEELGKLHESVALRGNDRLIWMLMVHFEGLRASGVECPEERVLDDERLRAFFVDRLVEDPEELAVAAPAPGFWQRLLGRR